MLKQNDSQTESAEPIITYSTDEPDESKENADSYNWQGAADEPKKIRINKIGVDAYVQKAGIDQNNEVAVPTNVHLTGWFFESVKPGNNGLSIIAGHVSGQTTRGVFKELVSLQDNDKFEIELGDGTLLQYRVIDVTTVAEEEAADALFSQKPNTKSQVNLITCAGNYDEVTRRYDDRVVVAGELM